MTTETQHPHPHHPHAISGPSAIGVVVIVILCIGFVTTLAVVLVRAVTPNLEVAHIEGTLGDFPSRGQAEEEADRRVGLLETKERGKFTSQSGAAEDYLSIRLVDTEMRLHLMTIETQPGHWTVKWTANLRGSEAGNQEVISAWQAAASGAESPASDPR